MRRLTTVGILVLWAAVLAALFLHDPCPLPRATMVAEDSIGHTDSVRGGWWGVYLQGHKVGFVHHVLEEAPERVSFREQSVLVLRTLGEEQTVRISASGELSNSFAIQHLQFTLVSGPTRLEVNAVPRGRGLRVTFSPGGDEIDLDGPVSLPLGLRAAAMRPPLEAGRTIRGQAFDPFTRATDVLELRVGERAPLPGHLERRAWRVTERWRDVESVLWADDDGRLLREEGPMGLVAVREAREDAVRVASSADSDWDAVEAVSLPVEPPLDNPRGRLTLRVRLSGVPLERIPVDGGQTLERSDVVIERVNLDQVKSYALPYAASDRDDDLAATASLQADHPRIVTLTRTILGEEHDAMSATKLLVEWVHGYLHKVPTASLPNALEVLDTGRGDCNEHAVLLTALARSAGLPARIVNGLVYGERAFLYHAWTEVWIGRWVPVDAALNQFPTDATHIRLTVGDRDQQLLMMGILGNLAIDVISSADSDEPLRPKS